MKTEVLGEAAGHEFRGNQYKKVGSALSPGTPERDANFKAWFEGSKVVNEDGSPMVIYHGTGDHVTSFDINESKLEYPSGAIFMTDSKESANEYGYRGNAEARAALRDRMAAEDEWASEIEKQGWASIIDDPGSPYWFSSAQRRIDEAVRNDGMSKEEALRINQLASRLDGAARDFNDLSDRYALAENKANVMPVFVALKNPKIVDATHMSDWTFIEPRAIEAAIVAGNDGVIFKNVIDNASNSQARSNVYVAFKPNQIKSAIGNRGTFDPKDDDIRHSLAEEHGEAAGHEFRGNQYKKVGSALSPGTPERSANFKKWFGDSRVVNEDGYPKVVYHGTKDDFTTFDPAKISGFGQFGDGFYFAEKSDDAGGTGRHAPTAPIEEIEDSAEWNLAGFAWQRQRRKLSRDLTEADVKKVIRRLNTKAEIYDARSDIGMRESWNRRMNAAKKGPKELQAVLESDPSRSLLDLLKVERIVTSAPNVIPVYLSIKNPAIWPAKPGPEHDGLYVPEKKFWVAFKPSQIKSAIGNRGTFDASDPDMRHSDVRKTGRISDTNDYAETMERLGEASGHPFRGNQYTKLPAGQARFTEAAELVGDGSAVDHDKIRAHFGFTGANDVNNLLAAMRRLGPSQYAGKKFVASAVGRHDYDKPARTSRSVSKGRQTWDAGKELRERGIYGDDSKPLPPETEEHGDKKGHAYRGNQHTGSFRPLDPNVTKWIESHVGTEVKRTFKSGRDAIREAVIARMSGSISPVQAANSILPYIGLNSTQIRAAEKFAGLMEEKGYDPKVIAKESARYARELLQSRARTIASVELKRAESAAKRLAWQQMLADGVIPPDAGRRWDITSVTESTCEICVALDGQVVGLDEKFVHDGVEYDGPPEPHPACQCRLTLVLVDEEDDQGYSDELDVESHGEAAGHPFRGNQYTASFSQWFGNSKVTDKNGDPLLVFHGSTSKGIETFDTSRVTTRNEKGDHPGTYFTSDPRHASNYTRTKGSKTTGEVVSAYLRIENPLDTTALIRKYRKSGMTFGDAKRKALESLGPQHDGIIFRGDSMNPAEYVVFHPNQIKRSSNSGEFSRTDDRSTHGEAAGHEFRGNQYKKVGSALAPGTLEREANFKKWFEGSKVINEDGSPRAVYHGSPNSGFDNFKVSQGMWGQGVYFSAIPEMAADYSVDDSGEHGPKSAVYPVYLALKNPIRSEDLPKDWISSDDAVDDIRTKAIAAGYDGIIVRDNDEYVAFYPWQIKSAHGNRGTFSPRDKRITHGEADSWKRHESAANLTNLEPTPDQIESGSYRKAIVQWNGLDIAIETPRGATRRAKDGSWKVENMPAHYGYVISKSPAYSSIESPIGADGDEIDVYLGKDTASNSVFVVDQFDYKTGRFDEAKVMLGFETEEAARNAYIHGFSDGHGEARIGAISEISVDAFKAWLGTGETALPFSDTEEQASAIFEKLAASLDDETLGESAGHAFRGNQYKKVGSSSAPKSSDPGRIPPGDPRREKNLKTWFGDSKVADEDGKPLVVFHGTASTFNSFDPSRQNIESDMGAGFYFSNESSDVSENYAGEGPDLTMRIERRAEQIAMDLNPDDYDGDEDEMGKAAKALARKELSVEHGGAALPVYLKIENPAVFGGDHETFLDYEEEYENDEPTGLSSGKLADFMDAIRSESRNFNDGEVDDFLSDLMEDASDGGLSLGRIHEKWKALEKTSYFTDDNGNMAQSEVFRRALERIGFDGIIDHTVDKKFGSQKRIGKAMEGMNPDTVHYIVFKPNQIKSALGNRGTFDPYDNDIRHSEIHGETAGHEFRGNQYVEGKRGERVRDLQGKTVELWKAALWLDKMPPGDEHEAAEKKVKDDIARHVKDLIKIHGLTVDLGPMSIMRNSETDAKVDAMVMRLHSQIANQPESILDHMRTIGYSIRIDPTEKLFDVGGASFKEGAHVMTHALSLNRGRPEMVLRLSAFGAEPWDTQISESGIQGVMAHEFGHVAVEMLSSRIAEARGRSFDPETDLGPIRIRDADGKPTGVQKFSEDAIKYDQQIGMAMSNFTFATVKEGGLTKYSEAYAALERGIGGIKLVDDVSVDPSVKKGWQASVSNFKYAVHSTSRAAGENFSEWMQAFQSRNAHASPTKFSVTAFKKSMASQYPDKPEQLKSFMVLLKEVMKKRPRTKVIRGSR